MNKIMIINNSGNVGKSFLSRELFFPHLVDGAKIIEIETNNSSSSKYNIETIKIDGDDFETLNRQVLMSDDYVIDLGASQIEKMLIQLDANRNIFEDIDMIIVPTIPNVKEIDYARIP